MFDYYIVMISNVYCESFVHLTGLQIAHVIEDIFTISNI